MPDLSKYLFTIYSSEQKQEYKCDTCGEVFSKKASLASHKKIHTKKGKNPKIPSYLCPPSKKGNY